MAAEEASVLEALGWVTVGLGTVVGCCGASVINVEDIRVAPETTVREVMACLDRTGHGIVLVIGPEGGLTGTLTDGDIRRAILAGMDLRSSAAELLERRVKTPHPTPLTCPIGTVDTELRRLMSEYGLRHIPLLDERGRVVNVAMLSELVEEAELQLSAVVMAGGYGTRLRPLTETVPKPMLLVGDRPLLELTLERLRQSGIRRVSLSTHYREDVIAAHFGDGSQFGVEIRYIQENEPRGTAGAVGMLGDQDEPLLVINGDILTRVDFRAMLAFHHEHHADMTVAVRQHELAVPYGVLETEGVRVTKISEKPVIRQFINAGIYLLNPDVCRLVPPDERYDMPDLINRLLADQRTIVSFPVHEYWLDIGREQDYAKAVTDAINGSA